MLIAGGTAIGAVLTDRAGLHVGANRTESEMTGFSPSEMLTKSIWDLLSAADREQSRAVWRLADTGRLAGSVTIVTRQGLQRESQYCAFANVLRGAHLSVFMPHPFEASAGIDRRRLVGS